MTNVTKKAVTLENATDWKVAKGFVLFSLIDLMRVTSVRVQKQLDGECTDNVAYGYLDQLGDPDFAYHFCIDTKERLNTDLPGAEELITNKCTAPVIDTKLIELLVELCVSFEYQNIGAASPQAS